MIIKSPKRIMDKSDEIAIHNGFNFAEITPINSKKEIFLAPEEKNIVLDAHKLENFKNKYEEPFLIYYDKPLILGVNHKTNSRTQKNIGLDIIGVQKSIAEAILINTAVKILSEEGYKNFFVDINSIGDRDSISKFSEEFFGHCKRNSGALEPSCKKEITKNNIMEALNCEHSNCRAVRESAPKPINYLSEQSREHFKEVLEYLEEMDIPYRINESLMSSNNHYSKTIFEIKTTSDKKSGELILARGGRYDDAAYKIIRKKNISAVGISLQYKRNKIEKAYSNKIETPQIFLIRFGFIAKIKSFEIVDILRKNKVTVFQSIHNDKLSDQFEKAKEMKFPFLIIIGQKEAMENEVIVRNTVEAYQETVKIEKLPQFLRMMKII